MKPDKHGWLPMAAEFEHGTRWLVWRASRSEPEIGRWDARLCIWRRDTGGAVLDPQPTEYQPLPAPPESET